jgi:peroxiredoxin
MKNLLAAILMATLPVSATALPAVAQLPAGMELGPTVGAKAPPFTIATIGREARNLQSDVGEKGATLVFVRSADWCPFCKLQLRSLNEIADDLDAMGWPVTAISCNSPEVLDTFTKANSITYSLMSDPGSKAIDAFGLRNEAMNGKARFEGIPHPIILFIAKDGTVKAKLYEEAYQKRPTGEVVVQKARTLT